LAQDALLKAIALKRPDAGLIHHSDRGAKYCCHTYPDLLSAHGIVASMSKKGNPYDNAMAENFFSCIKCERLSLTKYATRHEAQLAVFEYIDGFYNRRCRHGSLGWKTPVQCYQSYQAGLSELAHAPVGDDDDISVSQSCCQRRPQPPARPPPGDL
jgi:transposase InsO family protein